MIRMQVELTEAQVRDLKQRAAGRHVSVSALIRQAVDDWVSRDSASANATARRRAIAAAGRFASGQTDISERHDDYLAEAYRE